MIEEVKLVREELQMFWAEIKQRFTAATSSLTCSKHASGFAQDTTTTECPPVSRRTLVSCIGDLTTTCSTNVVGNTQHSATLFDASLLSSPWWLTTTPDMSFHHPLFPL
jgi:hypothetical protein